MIASWKYILCSKFILGLNIHCLWIYKCAPIVYFPQRRCLWEEWQKMRNVFAILLSRMRCYMYLLLFCKLGMQDQLKKNLSWKLFQKKSFSLFAKSLSLFQEERLQQPKEKFEQVLKQEKAKSVQKVSDWMQKHLYSPPNLI